MFGLSLSADNSEAPSYRRWMLCLGAGLLAACLVLCVYLMFFAGSPRSFGVAFVVSFAAVFAALFTGPWAVVQLLLGVRGSYYAFVTVTGLLITLALFYVQIKYLPRRFQVFLVGADVFIVIFLLGWARILAW